MCFCPYTRIKIADRIRQYLLIRIIDKYIACSFSVVILFLTNFPVSTYQVDGIIFSIESNIYFIVAFNLTLYLIGYNLYRLDLCVCILVFYQCFARVIQIAFTNKVLSETPYRLLLL